MTDATNRRNLPQVRSGPLIVGGILAGTGAMLTAAAGGSAWQNESTARVGS